MTVSARESFGYWCWKYVFICALRLADGWSSNDGRENNILMSLFSFCEGVVVLSLHQGRICTVAYIISFQSFDAWSIQKNKHHFQESTVLD